MEDAKMRSLLKSIKTIAVVGLSDKEDRPSYGVAAYLQRRGYRIIPVNPRIEKVLGEKSYGSLKDIPEQVDLVDIFRKSEEVLPVVEEALGLGIKAVWMQEGIVNVDAARLAESQGAEVVMDKCILKEHRRLLGE